MPAALAQDAPLFIVLNQASGSGDPDRVEASIRRSLEGRSREHEILRVDDPAQLPTLAQRAVTQAQERDGAVVVVGGDGTINAVTQAVLPSGVLFGVV